MAVGRWQKRFDFGEMAHDEFPLFRALAARVGHPVLKSAAANRGWSAPRHDRVEAVIEAALAGNGADDFQGRPSSPAKSRHLPQGVTAHRATPAHPSTPEAHRFPAGSGPRATPTPATSSCPIGVCP